MACLRSFYTCYRYTTHDVLPASIVAGRVEQVWSRDLVDFLDTMTKEAPGLSVHACAAVVTERGRQTYPSSRTVPVEDKALQRVIELKVGLEDATRRAAQVPDFTFLDPVRSGAHDSEGDKIVGMDTTHKVRSLLIFILGAHFDSTLIARVHKHTHTHTHNTHTHTHTHTTHTTHTRTHTHTYRHAHTHSTLTADTHIHTYILPLSRSGLRVHRFSSTFKEHVRSNGTLPTIGNFLP
jgi:hypothetical protein